ncbi:MAG: histidine--tRNA ligase [Gracilibacteraceae bacterium]|jgi:histidyl-tRNA synthetase|nr:histidine--tRNA ligase [Gracilibacteraceae bacterium]
MAIKRPQGTQDILPRQTALWQYVEEKIRSLCRRCGYEEIRTPILEATELFQRGVGMETDIVNKEMFTFRDKGDRSLTLRPEGTAAVARAYAEHKLYGQTPPWKLYYLGPMFRYEKPQAGRFHQFHQFGLEALGTADPLADAEAIWLAWTLGAELGLRGLALQLNSVGCPLCREKHRAALTAFLAPQSADLCPDCLVRLDRNPLRVLDCKNENCRARTAGAPALPDYLCPECREHFAAVRSYLDELRLPYQLNERLVRGLDYYRKTAFEILAPGLGAQNAICGGGRYDGLVEEIGGPPTPGVGFALGLERLLGALAEQNTTPSLTEPPCYVLAALGPEARRWSAGLAAELRAAGFVVLMDLEGRSLKSQLKFADRRRAAFTLICGEDELARGNVLARDMRTGEQREIPRADLLREMENSISKERRVKSKE